MNDHYPTSCGPPGQLRRVAFAVILSALAANSPAVASDFSDLQKEYSDAEEAWSKPGEGKAVDFRKHPAAAFIPRFRKLANANKGTDDGLAAVKWVAEHARFLGGTDRDAVRKAFDWAATSLTNHYASHAEIKDALAAMSMAVYFDVKADRLQKLYDKVIATNKNDECVASAMFNSAVMLLEPRTPAPDGAADRNRAIDLLKKLRSDYGKTTAGGEAAPYLFEAENLQIGMKAPDIVGKSVDGTEIKLSQFKGNVVVLDFWGFW